MIMTSKSGRLGGSGLDAGPVGIYAEGKDENGYCMHKGHSTATNDKENFLLHRLHSEES